MPDAFIDLKRVTKSYIPAANAPEKINVQEGQPSTANESKATIKHGRPLGSKDKKKTSKMEGSKESRWSNRGNNNLGKISWKNWRHDSRGDKGT